MCVCVYVRMYVHMHIHRYVCMYCHQNILDILL